MAKQYKGSLSLDWYNKQKAILLRSEADTKTATDIPAPKINWVNKEEALFYEINEQEGKGVEPYWVDRNDIRVKEARPLIFQKAYKAIPKNKEGSLPGMVMEFEVVELNEDDATIENILIKGDNLLALNTLKKIFDNKKDEDKVKCIFIDPPYNTGYAFEQYDDNLARSEWLTLMRDRLTILKEILSSQGSIWITIDEVEGHYLKILCDEVFGRECYITTIVWRSTDNSNNDSKQFSNDHNFVLVYSKIDGWLSKKVSADEAQIQHYKNPDNDPKGPWFDGNPISSPNYRENLIYDLISPSGSVIKPPRNGWRWSKETMQEKILTGEVRFTEKETNIKRRTYLSEHEGLPPSNLWIDLKETGHNRQAKYEQKKLYPELTKDDWFATPKPEKLIQKILFQSTSEGDLVLDCFGGSGTTFSVAHKMNRRWIAIEVGEQANTHIITRLSKVLINSDDLGISKEVNWKGGGSFKYYHLGESIIKLNEDGTGDFNWSLGKEFIQESFLSSYDYMIDTSIDFRQGNLFTNKKNQPLVGVQTIGTKRRIAVITLNEPNGNLETLSYDELQSIYKTVKKKYSPEYINIFTNRGIEISYDSKPDDLEIIKIPTAIFAELEK
ncbi:site-specific DNA-methyltransferase [Flavobacterium filum]|uniref:site-specific DNA-methyltransferase n=1 Tax=Flavobacterium filum TaxID=370974 RepID=UPI0023F2001A|nr:site-specific DNA-methyltransferase [Flavobacterium filum]